MKKYRLFPQVAAISTIFFLGSISLLFARDSKTLVPKPTVRDLGQAESQIITSSSRFGFEQIKIFHDSQKEDKIFISPLSFQVSINDFEGNVKTFTLADWNIIRTGEELPEKSIGVKGRFETSYSNGKLHYTGVVMKPTPCNWLKNDENIIESYPVQVKIDIRVMPYHCICVQVIEKERVEGTIDIGHEPGSVRITVYGEACY